MERQLKSIFVMLLLVLLGAFLTYAIFNGSLGAQAGAAKEKLEGQPKILTSEKDFRDKVTELRIQKQKISRRIKKLEMHKAETLQHLKDKGINSSADITDDKDVLYALRNLKGWKEQIDKLEKDTAHFDEAIGSIEVMLDELERKRIDSEVALSEEQHFQLLKIVKDLNERLGMDEKDILADDELSQLLDEELEKESAGQ